MMTWPRLGDSGRGVPVQFLDKHRGWSQQDLVRADAKCGRKKSRVS